MLETLTRATFAECQNEKFQLQSDVVDPFDVELIEVSALTKHIAADATEEPREPFSLVFRGPKEPVLPQHIYRLTHPRLGSLDLFLVPIGPDTVGMQYESVFT